MKSFAIAMPCMLSLKSHLQAGVIMTLLGIRFVRQASKLSPFLLLVSMCVNVFLFRRYININYTVDRSEFGAGQEKVNSSVSFYAGNRDSRITSAAFCSVFSAWTSKLIEPLKRSNLKDWSFTKRIKCPNISVTEAPRWRTKVSLDCTIKPRLILTNTSRSSDVHSVKLGDSCLNKVIDNCCTGQKKIPNIVHYIWYSDRELGFFNLLSFMSVMRFVKPCLFIIHGTSLPTGPHWDFFVSISPNIVHVVTERPTQVYGHPFAYKEHASDIMRIDALIAHGGIYLDYDELVLQPLEPLRVYEYTQGHEMPTTLGSQLVMARRNATFLHLWRKTYDNDYRKAWAYNALIAPNNLAKKNADLIHIEGFRFTRPNWKNVRQIFEENFNWSLNYGMHLFIRWYKKPISVTIIRTLNTTIGAVSRHILFGNKELCSD